MKNNKSTFWVVFLLILVASLYRLIDVRPAGFAPQMAMALFGGAVIKDKKWAFVLPIFSLFISDLLFYGLHAAGLTVTLGFYAGQWAIYLTFALITVFGFLLRKINPVSVALFTIAGSVFFFLVTNFITWQTGYGLGRPHTFNGLLLCYNDALLFYKQNGIIHGFLGNFIFGDMIWSTLLFGSYYVLNQFSLQPGTKLTPQG